jgi:two-component system, sensor histidine kinase PdtaS
LLLNAVEHGLRGRRRGAIQITLCDLGDAVELVLEDDGNGLPADFSIKSSNSLGLQIVQTLVTDDLKGKLRLESIEAQSMAAADYDDAVAAADPATAVTGSAAVVTTPKRGARATVIFPKRSLGVD